MMQAMARKRCQVRVTSSNQKARLLHIGEGDQASRSLYLTHIATTQTLYLTLIATTQTEVV